MKKKQYKRYTIIILEKGIKQYLKKRLLRAETKKNQG